MIKTKSTLIEKVNLKNFYLIAEIGNNHEGSFSKAKKLILEAKKSGADAVKFQFINPSMLVSYKDVGRFKQLNKYLFSLLLQSMSVSLFPVDYERFTDKMMSLPLPLYVEPIA